MHTSRAPRSLSPSLLSVLLGLGLACDPEPTPDEPEQAAEEEAASLNDFCAQDPTLCGDDKADGFGQRFVEFVLDLVDVARGADDWTALACPRPDQMDHFVDLAEEVDGVPRFTSVQDFTIRRADLSPTEVLEAFRDDWLVWWEGGTIRDNRLRFDQDDHLHLAIRPLGLSAVEIDMDIGLPLERPEHPALASPALDEQGGHEAAWDVGLEIGMSGNAFHGTMFVLARETDQGVAVREIWHHTEPVAPLVMDVLGRWPFHLAVEQRLRVAAFLHIAATQGCAFPRGTGYPGLIEAFESGRLPAD